MPARLPCGREEPSTPALTAALCVSWQLGLRVGSQPLKDAGQTPTPHVNPALPRTGRKASVSITSTHCQLYPLLPITNTVTVRPGSLIARSSGSQLRSFLRVVGTQVPEPSPAAPPPLPPVHVRRKRDGKWSWDSSSRHP